MNNILKYFYNIIIKNFECFIVACVLFYFIVSFIIIFNFSTEKKENTYKDLQEIIEIENKEIVKINFSVRFVKKDQYLILTKIENCIDHKLTIFGPNETVYINPKEIKIYEKWCLNNELPKCIKFNYNISYDNKNAIINIHKWIFTYK